MPAVFQGNYVIKPDKGRSTPILNSYRFSQLTRAPRNLPQWRYESSCLDFRICHRHTDSCIFHLVPAILPPFILSFDFLSQIARNFMPPCLSSSLSADTFVCSLSRSLSRFLNFYSPSVPRFSSLSCIPAVWPSYCPCFYCGSYCVYQERVGRQQILFRIPPRVERARSRTFRKITLGIVIARTTYCTTTVLHYLGNRGYCWKLFSKKTPRNESV